MGGSVDQPIESENITLAIPFAHFFTVAALETIDYEFSWPVKAKSIKTFGFIKIIA